MLPASSRVRTLAAELLREYGAPDTDRRDARLRIGLRAACAASGFFQCLVRHGGNEEFLFDLVDGVTGRLRMIVHGNGSCGIYSILLVSSRSNNFAADLRVLLSVHAAKIRWRKLLI
jgi:hypothetical protein